MVCVVFDTSFLVNAVRGKVDFMKDIRMEIGPFKPVVTSPVIRELGNLGSKEARVARQILGDCEVVEYKGHADPSVIREAERRGCLLASTDKEVRQIARRKGIRLVTLREGKYIKI